MQKGCPWAIAFVLCAICASASAASAATRVDIVASGVRVEFADAMETWQDERADPLDLEPALPSTCRWDNDTTLACDFADAHTARNATRYLVHVPALKSQDGRLLPSQTLVAEMPRPVLSTSAYSVKWQDGIPRIEVTANQAVEAAAAAAVLRLRLDGRAVPAVLVPTPRDASTHTGFFLQLPRIDPSVALLELSVVPGLVGREGPLAGTQRALLLRARLNEPPDLASVSCTAGARPAKRTGAAPEIGCDPGIVTLAFKRPFDAASELLFAQRLPAGVQLVRWGNLYRTDWRGNDKLALPPAQEVELRIEAARTQVRIPIGPGLASIDARPAAATTVVVDVGDWPAQLRSPHASFLLADPDTPLPVNALNADVGASVTVQTLAGSNASSAFAIPRGEANVPSLLHDGATQRALAEGGWARWTLPFATHRNYPPDLQFAAPGLDVFALAGSSGVLVWINDWNTGEGVSGARADLLLLGGDGATRTIASATSGDDGVAHVSLPAAYTLAGDALATGEWFVRVESGSAEHSRRAVLPLGKAAGYDVSLGKPGAPRAWGVTDRPIYRAGDRIRFRLWHRSVRAGRLFPAMKPGPTILHLVMQGEDKTIRSWAAQPDPGAGWSGEVVVPEHANDGIYCITPFDAAGQADGAGGACFFVGTYRSQDLWAEAITPDRVLHAGDRLDVDVTAGYYSGGPAAEVGLRKVTTMLTPLPLSQAYPKFADYSFVDVSDDAGDIALQLPSLPAVTDAGGSLALALPVAFEPDATQRLPAFARLQVTAELALDAREGTVSNAATARFTRHDAFVGLRLEPRWLDAMTPVHVEAVVIDADGKLLAPRAVTVDIDFIEDVRNGGTQRVGTCQLTSGTLQPCDFPRARSGRYRLSARSGTAAPGELEQYVWTGDQRGARAPRPVVEVVDAPAASGDPVRVLLRQVEAGWPVLFVVSQHGRILAHRRARTASHIAPFDLALPPGAEGKVDVSAYLRDPASGKPDGALRTPASVAEVETAVTVPKTARKPIELAFAPSRAAPGARATLTLHNASAEARDVTVSVMDDALRALAGDILAYADPQGPNWLGGLASGYYGSALTAKSFAGWNGRPWSALLPPAHKPKASGNSIGDRTRFTGEDAREAPPVIFDDPTPMSAPAPPPSPPSGASARSGQELDRVEVTASRIRSPVEPGAGKGRVDVPGQRPEPGAAGLLTSLARVRGMFTDTALWLGDIRLQPGERRSIEVALPDNLTRWRAVAWSADAGDDFDMAEATIESGLPVEARLQVPVRIYSGDRARLVGNARQTAAKAAKADVVLQARGAGADAQRAATVALAARGQQGFALDIAPGSTGTVEAVAAARTAAGSDGIGARIEVAPVMIEGRRVQAGLLTGAGVVLDLPVLGEGATDARLHVEVLRGGAGLVDNWTGDLRDYPHRCWEQILSRAVGASLAIERGDKGWPDAKGAVAEALDNAAVFQDDEGGFHYFADSIATARRVDASRREVALTAYSVRALELLRRLGHPVAPDVLKAAHAFLARSAASTDGEVALAEAAFASQVTETRQATREALWNRWATLPLPARIAMTRGLAQAKDPNVSEAYRRLLSEAPLRGSRRTLAMQGDWTRWMASPIREQCAMIDLFDGVPALQAERGELIAGLTDLYAGGLEGTDTQSSAICLMALDGLAAARNGAINVDLQAGATHARLQVVPGSDRTQWQSVDGATGQLLLKPATAEMAPSSYVAELRYQEDARLARSSAVGLDIARRYDVLRAGTWQPLNDGLLQENDWVRVTLTVSTSATRYFVAVTDAVPGGLQPTDLRLSGVGGLDIQALSDTGSYWFQTRRLDPRSPKFYAEQLPAGHHELHYFARVGNTGDYLAAPATAELMYGTATRARTAARRIRIDTVP